MKSILYVALGGALGSVLRYGITVLFSKRIDSSFPILTFSINVLGSLLIGIFAACFFKSPLANENYRLFLITGLCGGFTTFSTFSLESLQLIQSGQTTQAALYIVASVLVCIAFTFIGFQIGTK